MKTRLISLAISLILLPALALAETNGGINTGTTLENPLGSGVTLPKLISEILQFVTILGSIVVVFMIIYIGFKYVTVARSNPGKIGEIHTMLMWTVVGALILLGAQAIALGIEATVREISNGL